MGSKWNRLATASAFLSPGARKSGNLVRIVLFCFFFLIYTFLSNEKRSNKEVSWDDRSSIPKQMRTHCQPRPCSSSDSWGPPPCPSPLLSLQLLSEMMQTVDCIHWIYRSCSLQLHRMHFAFDVTTAGPQECPHGCLLRTRESVVFTGLEAKIQ